MHYAPSGSNRNRRRRNKLSYIEIIPDIILLITLRSATFNANLIYAASEFFILSRFPVIWKYPVDLCNGQFGAYSFRSAVSTVVCLHSWMIATR
jgi:hypothetical protein